MKNIVLIGMPGCGKSTAGVLLAKHLGLSFMDTDVIIQAQTGRKLQQILDEDGMDAFLRLEEEVLSGIECSGTVIATGGSAVYGAAAMKHLSENGRILYIRLTLDTILSRLSNAATRGIALRPGQTLAELYEERIRLYEKYADAAVDAEGLRIEETVLKLADAAGRC